MVAEPTVIVRPPRPMKVVDAPLVTVRALLTVRLRVLKSRAPAELVKLSQVKSYEAICRVPAPEWRIGGCVAEDFGEKTWVPVVALNSIWPVE